MFENDAVIQQKREVNDCIYSTRRKSPRIAGALFKDAS